MAKAVRFNQYGDVDVLQVVEIPRPTPGAGEVLVRVKAAGINPGEAKIRQGLLHDRFPATFPSGQGSDLAGVIEEVGQGVEKPIPGDEVIGFTDNRASQADYVAVEAGHVVAKPPNVPWDVAGSLFVAGTTAFAAVRAVSLHEGDTVVVSGAAGGVGSIAVQLARLQGAVVIGIAGDDNHQWLRDHGVRPVSYGDDVIEQIHKASDRVDAFIDTYGDGYVELAVKLGVAPGRIDTIADFEAVARYGVKAEGNAAGGQPEVLAELAGLVAEGKLEVPIKAVYPLDEVRDAYRELASGHIRGKIVLEP
jgi:NADPH:quinone reductase-like Zn-dependent oxidoreductase